MIFGSRWRKRLAICKCSGHSSPDGGWDKAKFAFPRGERGPAPHHEGKRNLRATFGVPILCHTKQVGGFLVLVLQPPLLLVTPLSPHALLQLRALACLHIQEQERILLSFSKVPATLRDSGLTASFANATWTLCGVSLPTFDSTRMPMAIQRFGWGGSPTNFVCFTAMVA